jgi:DNA replication licensing factor MCM2
VQQEQTQAEIKRRFRDFLENYRLARGERVHDRLIDDMCAANESSLHISYMHLSHYAPILAIWIADVPRQMLVLFNEVATRVVFARFPDYWNIATDITVRILDLPIIDSLRELRQAHLNAFVKVSGVITRRTGIFPQLKLVYYNCNKCSVIIGPVHQNESSETKVGACPNCQSRGPFQMNSEQTVYRNYQKMTLQEAPGKVPPGRVPRYKDVILVGMFFTTNFVGKMKSKFI